MQASSSILVVDDDGDTRELLHAALESAGFSVRTASDGSEGLKAFFASRPDLAILDVRMPRMDGWALLDRIREVSNTPVIMLTILGHGSEVVRGLDGGADDYVPKPFSQVELLARVKAVLRRAGEADAGTESYEDPQVHIDFQQHRLFVRGNEVRLSPLEFRLMGVLVQHAGHVLSHDRLLDLCWGEDRPGGPINVRVYINFLRRKIEADPENPLLIETVREFGYRYSPPKGKD
jgi:DNA-binding response OmpR family regulator